MNEKQNTKPKEYIYKSEHGSFEYKPTGLEKFVDDMSQTLDITMGDLSGFFHNNNFTLNKFSKNQDSNDPKDPNNTYTRANYSRSLSDNKYGKITKLWDNDPSEATKTMLNYIPVEQAYINTGNAPRDKSIHLNIAHGDISATLDVENLGDKLESSIIGDFGKDLKSSKGNVTLNFKKKDHLIEFARQYLLFS